MSDATLTKETVFASGQRLWWNAPSIRLKAEFIKMSTTGKRARIKYWFKDADQEHLSVASVHPSRLEPRND